MKLQITKQTKWTEIQPLWEIIKPEDKLKLFELALKVYDRLYWDFTVSDLFKLIDGVPIIEPDDSAYCGIWYLGLLQFAELFAKIIERYTVKGGDLPIVKFSFKESVLIELYDSFKLPFSKLELLPIADYVILRKYKYSQIKELEREMSKFKRRKG